MKLDKAINEFMEKYDENAINSIDELSSNIGLRENRISIKLFNLKESFDNFNKYLTQYADYKIKNINNSNASSRENIKVATERFMDNMICKESEIPYGEISEFVKSYLTGVNTLLKTVDNIKDLMESNGVDYESIGDVNDYCDNFIDKINESFEPAMHRILWASGYNGRHNSAEPIYKINNKKKVEFI